MCSRLMATLQKGSLSQRLREQIGANDPASKALGFEGAGDPWGDFLNRQAGRKSKLDKKIDRKAERQGQRAFDLSRPDGPPGHIASIAAMRAKRGG